MIQRPLQAKMEIQNETPAHQEAAQILNWIVHGHPYAKNPLFTHKSRNERILLLQALREKLQMAFTQLFQELSNKTLDAKKKERLKLLNAYLLAFYPYSEPESGATLLVPQEVGENQWAPIEYRIRRLDLTPQSGFLASLFKEEDRLHAYALETSEAAQPHLLFMGTPFPINHGSNLGMLHNFSLRASPGEAHDKTRVNEWLAEQKSLTVIGHSQGAINAMIIAAEQPHRVTKALCFCPAKLYNWTLNRLSPQWQQAALSRPDIYVYTPEGDLLFAFGTGFLPGTKIHKMVYNKKSTQLRDTHIPCGAGCDSFHLVDLNQHPQPSSLKEDFLSQAAVVASPLIFMARYLKFYNKLLADKFKHRYLAPLALLFLGANWLLYKKVTHKAPAFWALLASFFLVQKSHKAARIFWHLAHVFSGLLGAVYASVIIGPDRLVRTFAPAKTENQGSSASILAALKIEASSLAERNLPLASIKQLGETLSNTKTFYTQLYYLWEKERKARSSGLIPTIDETPDKKAYTAP